MMWSFWDVLALGVLACYLGGSLCIFSAWVVYKLICRKKRGCTDDSCPIRDECDKITLTEREIEELKTLLAEWRKK